MLIRNNVCFVYDVEVFPNFFSVTVKNTESGNYKQYEIGERRNDLPDIAKLFLHKGIVFCGYNVIHYDNPIISYLLLNYKKLVLKPVWEVTAEIKAFSDKIITSETSASWSQYKYANLFLTLDLLTMKWSQKLRPSLKALQVTMEYQNVEEYSGNFEKSLPKSEIENVLSYNKNDVDSTEELLNRSKKDIELRLAIEDEYHISALNKDGVNLGMEIIKTRYLQATNKQWFQIKDLRSPCTNLCFADIIFPFISFKTPTLQNLLKELKELCVNPNDNSFEKHFILGGVEHTFAMGGVHSVNEPERFEPDDDEELEDVDVDSMYPSIIVSQGLYPQHLGPEFTQVYAGILYERLEAKRNGNKLKNETLKLSVNGLSGNLQSEYSWCYDPKMALTIRINGQLMLLMLAEGLSELGCRIIQSNTDGVFVLMKKPIRDKAHAWCDEWCKITGLTLAADHFERFYQYAINDYIGVKEGWSKSHDPKLIKTKGMFIQEPQLGKGLAPLIIPEALNKYFVEGISPEETIYGCKDIKKFCTFQKVDKKFEVFYGGERTTHINRYYMSLYGKPIYKQKVDEFGKPYGSQTALCASSPVTIYNKFDDIPIEKRGINYNYYLSEVYKIIEKMDKKQLSLW